MKPRLVLFAFLLVPLLMAELRVSGPITMAGGDRFFTVEDSAGKNVRFRYSGITPITANAPNFILVPPQVWTTPAYIEIGLNPTVVGGIGPNAIINIRVNFETVDESPPSAGSGIINYRRPPIPAPAIQSVVNTASFQPFLSPGAMVSIFGSSLAAPRLFANFDDTARYPTTLASATVTFSGVPAPLLYVSETQINAVVPYALAGQSSAEVVVSRFFRPSATFTVALRDTSPAIFTASQTGSGQAAIRQVGPGGVFTYNSAENPASRGTAFELFSTGAGVWDPPVYGDIEFGSLRNPLGGKEFITQPVSLTIGGRPARIFYAGTSPYQVWGLLQVNAVVPDDVGSGPQPLVLKVGPNDSSRQMASIAIE